MGDPIANFGLPVAIALTLALLIVPPLMHLWTGWNLRRSEIVGQLSGRGIRLYFLQFRPAVVLAKTDSPRDKFKHQYGVNYGRRHYIIPLILLTLVGSFLLWLVLRFGVDSVTDKTAKNDLPVLAVAAVAGAYLWVVMDLVRRCHSRELSPFDINRASLRLAVAIPLGYVFTATFGDNGAWLAFLLGAFPLDTLTLYARKLVNARLNLNADDPNVSDLTKLDGITKDIADRLRDVGISTINQLAFVDPIDLSIRTNLQLSYVTDCVSQALAYDYLQDKMNVAKKYFLRGAVEIDTLVNGLHSSHPEYVAEAQETLEKLAADLRMDIPVLRRALEVEVSGDTHTQFLADLQLSNAISDAAMSIVQADPSEVPADGVTESHLTVRLRSAEGRAIRGEAVNIIVENNHDVVILPEPTARTDDDGIAHFTVSSRGEGKAIFAATDTMENVQVSARAKVTFTAVVSAAPASEPAPVNGEVVPPTTVVEIGR